MAKISRKEHNIIKLMKNHYQSTFRQYGPTPAGVDWGKMKERTQLRYRVMFSVIAEKTSKPSLLDVGCGYGGLMLYAEEKKIDLDYTGIDLAPNMINWAKNNISSGKFIEGDFLKTNFKKNFDYVIANGILTQKLTATNVEMDEYMKKMTKKMFGLCRKAVAFNVMTTEANYYAPNLYYKHPVEILSYSLSEITKKVKIDHSYGLYEFTTFLFK